MTFYAFSDLLDIMARLRAPDGCPWDREQTHASILSCLIEETYEFVDAVERNDIPNMREELGDLLLQVVFHSQMTREAKRFGIEDVIQGLCEKLVRRHPHVFAEGHLENADQVQSQWDELKKAEKKETLPLGALGEMPTHLPALLKAFKIQKRAAKTGFDWPDYKGASAKVVEELGEFETEIEKKNLESATEELGDLLFSVVNLGRLAHVDPERALARANAKFVGRFVAMEKQIEQDGKSLEKMSLADMDTYWERVKKSQAKESLGN